MDVLAPDVVFIADGGGFASAAPAPVYGAEPVARMLAQPNRAVSTVWLNGAPALRLDSDRQVAVVSLVVEDGRISRIYAMANPNTEAAERTGRTGPVGVAADVDGERGPSFPVVAGPTMPMLEPRIFLANSVRFGSGDGVPDPGDTEIGWREQRPSTGAGGEGGYMQLLVAGYNAAPSQPDLARQYYEYLIPVSGATGLEVSWSKEETGVGVLDLLPDSWSLSLNLIGSTMAAAVTQPALGLASPDDAGRAAAVRMAREARDWITAINDRLGRRAVLAVEVQSAPGFGNPLYRAESSALRRSLEELVTLDWDGSELLLEHCDALIEGHPPAKGFLSLEAEIAVLADLGGTIGLSLNWGRSAIEGRDARLAANHVKQALAAGRLGAYTFSGASGTTTPFGEAWADTHHPFSETADPPGYGGSASLMTPATVAALAPDLAGCLFVAAKTNWPKGRVDPAERAASVRANFQVVAAGMTG